MPDEAPSRNYEILIYLIALKAFEAEGLEVVGRPDRTDIHATFVDGVQQRPDNRCPAEVSAGPGSHRHDQPVETVELPFEEHDGHFHPRFLMRARATATTADLVCITPVFCHT